MAYFSRCRKCGGNGRTKCWACHGTLEVERLGVTMTCPECIDGEEVCLDCDGEGGEYRE